MTSPEITVLLQRLSWPVEGVRWEAARCLAGLVRAGDAKVVSAIVQWMSQCRLETEVATGLSLIDAFELETFFDSDLVASAIKAPSHLSSLLFRRCFSKDGPDDYAFAPEENAPVTAHVVAYFWKHQGQVLPLAFKEDFTSLQATTGRPYLDRWEHEWCWLQVQHDEVLSSQPYWFSWHDHDGSGLFDLRQRDVYLSAFLRTLAFATTHWRLTQTTAESLAAGALAGLRGLAKLEYQERPSWSHDLVVDAAKFESTASEAWNRASNELTGERSLLALRGVNFTGSDFIELEIALVAGRGLWPERPATDETGLTVSWQRMPKEQLDFAGILEQTMTPEWPSISPLAITLFPPHFARWHLDIYVSGLCVASPDVFTDPVSVTVSRDSLTLQSQGRGVSSTKIWNTNWAPTKNSKLNSRIGRVTDIDKTKLDNFLSRTGVTLRRAAWVQVGRKTKEFGEFETRVETFWLDAI
ncbi:hypothetical protein [Asticcacaulis sp.]|uniref:hypothetical protein n=1 Tax=Asticcacaulis sp. TaxID=1872648 RepID=UPI003F7B5C46